jgi:hypothetical protein
VKAILALGVAEETILLADLPASPPFPSTIGIRQHQPLTPAYERMMEARVSLFSFSPSFCICTSLLPTLSSHIHDPDNSEFPAPTFEVPAVLGQRCVRSLALFRCAEPRRVKVTDPSHLLRTSDQLHTFLPGLYFCTLRHCFYFCFDLSRTVANLDTSYPQICPRLLFRFSISAAPKEALRGCYFLGYSCGGLPFPKPPLSHPHFLMF